MRTLCAALIFAASAATAAPMIPELEKAQAALAEGKVPQAVKLLDAVANAGKLDRDNLVLYFQLRGITWADLKKDPQAKAAFQSMLWIDPEAGVPPSADPKAFKIFRSAKDWLKSAPPLEFRAEPAATDDKGKVMQIAAFLKADPLKLVRKVRFWVRANGGDWNAVLEPVQSSYAATATEADGVEWWAEVLTDKDSVMFTLGSEDSPILEGKAKAKKPVARPKPVAKVEPKPADVPLADKEEKQPQPVARTSTEAKPFVVTGVRGLGFGLAAAGAVSAIIGIVCGAASAGTRGELTALPSDGTVISSMTQKEAFDKQASADGLAVAANVLLITGGVLAATGVVLVIVGGPSDDAKVTLAPAGSGVVLSGSW